MKSSREEDDLSQPWAVVKTERWTMPTWCHMFNSTLTGNARVWFDELPTESIDSYDDLKKAFLENDLQQKKWHNTDECMNLKKQIKEMLKAGKLSHLIKELKQNSGNEQPKATKKGETSGKDKALAILMVQPWERAPGVRKLQAVLSTAHGILKLPVEGGVIALKSSRLVPLECVLVSGPEETLSDTKPILEERVKVEINLEYIKQAVMTGSTLTEGGYNKLCGLLHHIQRLNGKLASLNRFLAKSSEKSLPFFKTLKKCTKKSDFHWTIEAKEAFKQMKQLIAELPMLTAPMEKEELIVYMAAAKETVDTSRLYSQMTRRGLAGYTDGSGRRNPRTMDSVHERILLHRWFWSMTDIHNPRMDGVHLCLKIQGIDIVGPFLKGPGKVKFLIVVIDYFTKWIKAKPVATITGNQIKKFMWDNIICRFKLPGAIISDNGKYLGEGIKARLDARSNNWMEELPHVLWAHHTMIKSSNGDTPFSLTYETEAVIPAEIDMPTLRTAEVDLVQNDETLRINLDLLEEKREQATIHEAKSKTKMEK
nr:gypsy retrotransposon integrase-like protein 1 [Tanacetum cinerariifolium]